MLKTNAMIGIGIAMVAVGFIGLVTGGDDSPPTSKARMRGNNNGVSRNNNSNCYRGELPDATGSEQRWAWDGDDSVTITVPGKVHYRSGEGSEVIVRGDPEAVRRVHVAEKKIEMVCGNTRAGDLDITLPGREFKDVSLGGDVHLTMEGLSQSELNLNIGGKGAVSLSGKADELNTNIGGSGQVTFADLTTREFNLNVAGTGSFSGTGKSGEVSVNIAGTGNADFTNVPMQEIGIIIAGVGDVKAGPTDEANILIMGTGKVLLLTHPKHVSKKIMGSGKVVEATQAGTDNWKAQ